MRIHVGGHLGNIEVQIQESFSTYYHDNVEATDEEIMSLIQALLTRRQTSEVLENWFGRCNEAEQAYKKEKENDK